MKEYLKSNKSTVLILITTLILGAVAIFTALKLYQLRQRAVAPTAPESKPAAQEEFDVASPTPTETPAITKEELPPPIKECAVSFNIEAPTATPTPTATKTPTPTLTPTITPTPSPTSTGTITPTPTATTTPTTTPTVAPTPTPTGTTSPTPLPELPEAGTLTPTTISTAAGILFIIFALILAL